MQLMALQAPAEGGNASGSDASKTVPPMRLKMSRELGATLPGNEGRAPASVARPPVVLRRSRELGITGAGIVTMPALGEPAREGGATKSLDATAANLETVIGGVRINGMRVTEATVMMRRPDGSVLARSEDVRNWGLRRPETETEIDNEKYFVLSDIPGLRYAFDGPSQELIVDAKATSYPGTFHEAIAPVIAPLGGVSPGGFLNYDFSATHVVPSATQVDGLLEGGFFNEWGTLTGTTLLRDLSENASVVRLDTTFTRDFPEKLASLRLGDSISNPGATGGSVRFGGVQWATNFATRPGYIAFPQPGVRGEASLPSVIDVYVNDSLRLSQNLPPGPFEIRNIPVVTGDGQIQLVQRDLLGRQQILTVPYYTTSLLLKEGLQAYSYEAGAVRENYGIDSSDYGRAILIGTHRYGFTDRFTGEFHAEALADQQMGGVAGTWLVSRVGTVDLGIAGSHSDFGGGAKGSVGWEKQMNRFAMGARLERASENFFKVGDGNFRTRALNTAFLGFTPGYGSLSINFTDQKRVDGRSRIASANYAIPVARNVSMNVLAVHSEDVTSNDLVSVTFTWAPDFRTTAVASLTHEHGVDTQLVQIQQALPDDKGVAFRVLAGAGDVDRVDAGVSAQNEVGLYSLDTSRINGQEVHRFEASGGVAVLGRNAFLSRRIDESFAVVKVPGYSNLGVYRNNRLVAHTDQDGVALLTGLLPYEANPISIEVTDLPIDTQTDLLQKDAVPRLRSGTLLEFNVRPSAGALLVVTRESGVPLPAGSIVTMQGDPTEFPVAERGEVFVTGLSGRKQFRATTAGKSCNFDVTTPTSLNTIPKIGPIVCK